MKRKNQNRPSLFPGWTS